MNDSKGGGGRQSPGSGGHLMGCLSAFRDMPRGTRHKSPTAVSQIIEALSKLLIGLGLAIYLVNLGSPAISLPPAPSPASPSGRSWRWPTWGSISCEERAAEPAGTDERTDDRARSAEPDEDRHPHHP